MVVDSPQASSSWSQWLILADLHKGNLALRITVNPMTPRDDVNKTPVYRVGAPRLLPVVNTIQMSESGLLERIPVNRLPKYLVSNSKFTKLTQIMVSNYCGPHAVKAELQIIDFSNCTFYV